MKQRQWLWVVLAGIIGIVANAPTGSAIETAPNISDREIIENLTAIRGDIKRIEQVMDQRFTAVDQRFTAIDRHLDNLQGFLLWGFGIVFAGIFSLIGFVLWDRRTALAPAIQKNQELAAREERLELVLKEFSKQEPRLAAVLRQMNLI